VADVHEDYLALLADRSWARGPRGVIGRVVARVATLLVARADLTLVADEHVPPPDARQRLVVRNLPRLEELPHPTPRAATPRALYVGDARISRGLALMLDAVEAAPGWRLDVVGPVPPAEQEWLERRRAAWAGLERPVFHGRLPMHEAWAVAQGAWCGFAVLDDTPAFRAAMPTKLYEYLAAGLAVLVTPLPRMAALVEEAGAGAVVADAEQASATLRRWQVEPEAADAHRAAARRWAEQQLTGESPFDTAADRVRSLVAR
jgi:glycosyltransferase involved in cell wall biosynthesis